MKLDCTAIVLVHQETPILWQCFASLAHFEHLLVVDAGSQIETRRFRAAGVDQVIVGPSPIQDFAQVRNEAMSHCKTPWCFFLDSDEVLDQVADEQLSAVRQLLQETTVAGLTVKRSDVFLQQKLEYGEAGNQSLVRFLRPGNARWEGKAHETPSIHGTIGNSMMTLSHYSHESIKSFISDVSNYAKIVSTQKNASHGSNLAQLLFFPPLKLGYDLLLLGAVLDGWRGVVYSYCMALHSLLVRMYWYENHTSLVQPTNTTTSN